MINIFVGCADSEQLPFKVLEYSIRKNTDHEISILPLGNVGIKIPTPIDPGNRARTTFSFQRFLIPELMGYKGKAIYLDSDMIVFKDIGELYSEDVESVVLRTHDYDTSVILINCDRADWNIETIVRNLDQQCVSYQGLFSDLQKLGSPISPIWNSHDRLLDGNPHGYKKEKTALLHYTTTKTQPWLARGHPLEHLWFEYLYEMLELQIMSKQFVEDAVTNRYLRPSILYQIRNRSLSSADLPRRVRQLDRGFISPHGMRLLHQGRNKIINIGSNKLYRFRYER
jgi:hypothetical protein